MCDCRFERNCTVSREVSYLPHDIIDLIHVCRVLLATIRDGGTCPCPRRLASKSQLHFMGHIRDLSSHVSNTRKYLGDKVKAARRHIYISAFGISSEKVDALLKEASSVPTVLHRALNCW
jgi:hypothetical protein